MSSDSVSWKRCPKRLNLHELWRRGSVVLVVKSEGGGHGRGGGCLEKCFCLPVSQEKGRAAGDKADRRVKRLFIPSDSRKTF